MSKPWDNEPTPIADMLTDDEDGFCCGIHDFQDIERRMRAAERLLVEVIESDPFWASISYKDLEDATRAKDEVIAKQAKVLQRIRTYLKAARMEDKK